MNKELPFLRRQSLPELVAREIGLRILHSDFQPGESLATEPELSGQLRVSRPVLREALKMLSAKGLIESRSKIGTRMRPRAEWNLFDPGVIAWQSESAPDLSFLLKICEVRQMFEPMTASLAATSATDEERERIVQICQEMLEVVIPLRRISTRICVFTRPSALPRITSFSVPSSPRWRRRCVPAG